jgi:hypothetical protein
VIGGAALRHGEDLEPQRAEIQMIHEQVDGADGVVVSNVILQGFREESGLPPILALPHESLHLPLVHVEIPRGQFDPALCFHTACEWTGHSTNFVREPAS